MVVKDTNINVFEQEKKISILTKKFGVLRQKFGELENKDANNKSEPVKISDPESQNVEVKCKDVNLL